MLTAIGWRHGSSGLSRATMKLPAGSPGRLHAAGSVARRLLQMRHRTFGRTGWQVGEVGYGMWGMGEWSGSDDAESLASLDLAVAKGVDFFDTAHAYGDGHSERLLARLVASHPGKRLFTATKVPPRNRQWPSRR